MKTSRAIAVAVALLWCALAFSGCVTVKEFTPDKDAKPKVKEETTPAGSGGDAEYYLVDNYSVSR